MAIVNYGETDRTRGVLTHTESQTNTAVTITVSATLQAKSYYGSGYRINALIAGTVVATALDVVPYPAQTSFTNAFSTSSASKTYTRGKTAQTVSIGSNYAGEGTGGAYAGSKSGSTSLNITIPAKPSYSVTYNANSGSGAPSSQTKWYGEALTLSSTKPTRTGYDFLGWATSSSATSAQYQPGATYSGNAALALYAVWKLKTYTVSYNANGGSGAPSAQTKTHGVNLTLSSTRPTRTGYTFLGWATSSTATTAAYQPSGSYTANAAATLYAVWQIITYSVTYDANGGSSAPSAQTKTYGQALTLSSTKPTRASYTFLGWATSSTATSAQYQPGGSYTTNAALALYAVWQLTYTAPKITNAVVYRCNSSGTHQDDGTQTRVAFNWSTFSSSYPGQTAEIRYWGSGQPRPSAANVTVSLSGTSGTQVIIVGSAGTFDPDSTYTLEIRVADSQSSSTYSTYISVAFFTMDVDYAGRSVGFGTTAVDPSGHSSGLMRIAMDLQDGDGNFVDALRHPVSVPNDSDLDAYMDEGLYCQGTNANTSNMTNIPEKAAFWLYVYHGSGLRTQKILYPANGHEYVRYYIGLDSSPHWSEWIPQGPPLAYITSVGNSGSFNYRKWSNGTVECWGVAWLGVIKGTTNQNGNIWYSDYSTVTIPSGIFTTTPSISASISDPWAILCALEATSATSFRFKVALGYKYTPKNAFSVYMSFKLYGT